MKIVRETNMRQGVLVAATFVAISICGSAHAADETTAKPSTSQQAAGKPSPEKMEEARQRFERGLQMFDEKNFEAARVELERAYAIAPTWKLLYNIGICYAQRGDYVEAVKDLERYLEEGGEQVKDERKEEVRKEMANLRPRIASVTIKTNVPDADLLLDDQPLGKVTTTPVWVNPGKRKFSVQKPGYVTGTEVVTPAGSDKVDLVIDLKPLPKASKTDVAPIIAWSVTGALAVGAGVTGYLSTRAQKSLDQERNSPTATASSLDDKSSQLKTGALVTDILMASTVVAAAASVYLTWFRKDSDSPAAADVKVGVSPSGVSVLGRF
jgi:hypothetical protein